MNEKFDLCEEQESWDTIIEDFKKARYCLCCPKHTNNWGRNEKDGYYYLLKAYHFASNAKEKMPQWYARILYLMASENRFKQGDYVILHQYLKPCVEAYKEALSNGVKVSELEVKYATEMYEEYLYVESCRENTDENYTKSCSYIEGFTIDDKFAFHDSKPISFTHDETSAQLVLKYDDEIRTFVFEELYSVDVASTDPETVWIFDFHCYPARRDSALLVFDVEYYKILCGKIKCISNSTEGK